MARPRPGSEVCGYVQAHSQGAPGFAAQNAEEQERTGIQHNNMRLVFAVISGWSLQFWRSAEDYQVAQMRGRERTPGPLTWYDLRQAQDVTVDFQDVHSFEFPNRIRVMTLKGNLYFRVEMPEDVPEWVCAIRRLIEEAAWNHVKEKDTPLHREKRWPAAKGLAANLLSGSPIGERALAIAYHLYDVDFDSHWRLGEIMLFILELHAGMLNVAGRAEGRDRHTAVVSAEVRLPRGELFVRALLFRRRCCPVHGKSVRKDGFINNGYDAILEAFDSLPDGAPAHKQGDAGESCSLM